MLVAPPCRPLRQSGRGESTSLRLRIPTVQKGLAYGQSHEEGRDGKAVGEPKLENTTWPFRVFLDRDHQLLLILMIRDGNFLDHEAELLVIHPDRSTAFTRDSHGDLYTERAAAWVYLGRLGLKIVRFQTLMRCREFPMKQPTLLRQQIDQAMETFADDMRTLLQQAVLDLIRGALLDVARGIDKPQAQRGSISIGPLLKMFNIDGGMSLNVGRTVKPQPTRPAKQQAKQSQDGVARVQPGMKNGKKCFTLMLGSKIICVRSREREARAVARQKGLSVSS
jgi:hypothetical protein